MDIDFFFGSLTPTGYIVKHIDIDEFQPIMINNQIEYQIYYSKISFFPQYVLFIFNKKKKIQYNHLEWMIGWIKWSILKLVFFLHNHLNHAPIKQTTFSLSKRI